MTRFHHATLRLLIEKRFDTVLDWRVRCKEVSSPATHTLPLRTKRVADEEVRGGEVRALHRCGVTADFPQRGGEAFRVASEESAGRVCEIFAAARNCHLN